MRQLTARKCDKRRFLAALNHEEQADVPFFETEFSPGIVNQILGINSVTRSYLMEPADYVDLMTACGIDMMYVGVPHAPGRKEVALPDGRLILADGRIKCADDLKHYVKQDKEPVMRRIEAILEASEGTGIGWCYTFGGPSNVAAQIGYNDYYLKLYEDPDFVHEFIKRNQDSMAPIMETVLDYKPDAIFLSVDLCYKTGLAMRMEMAEEFILSYLRVFAGMAVERNIPVLMHSDGDNTEMMETWIAMGVSALHPIEPCDKFNIFDIKKKWGDRIALMGNIDCQLLANGTGDEIRADVLEHMEALSAGGGYICGSSHDIDDNISLDNLCAMIDTATSYRRG